MNILVTGASGFIGSALVSRLAEERPSRCAAAPRSRRAAMPGQLGIREAGQIHLESAWPLDAVVHLAGENIAQRWTPAAKARIRASRVDATRLLCEALARLPQPPRVLVCASATGFYGDRGDEFLDEQSDPGTGFLAEVCQAWEAAADPARQRGIRVVHLRLGIVLARHGGALAKMLPVFRLGLGGRLGSGAAILELDRAGGFAARGGTGVRTTGLSGAVNAVSPEAATNADFTGALARALRRPAFLPVPALSREVAFGRNGPGGVAGQRAGAAGAAAGKRVCVSLSGTRCRPETSADGRPGKQVQVIRTASPP